MKFLEKFPVKTGNFGKILINRQQKTRFDYAPKSDSLMNRYGGSGSVFNVIAGEHNFELRDLGPKLLSMEMLIPNFCSWNHHGNSKGRSLKFGIRNSMIDL